MAKQRRQDRLWMVRGVTQGVFVAYVLFAAVRHYTGATETASVHALCPFGAVESLWSLVVGGKYLPKIHASSVVLSVGLLVGAVLVGSAFCGWICPFGALGDLLAWVRRKLRLPEVQVPPRLDGVLRYGRYVVLVGILYATVTTAKLWFADYDPYHVLFGLGWIWEPNLATAWPGYLITLGLIGGSLFINRLWCRYLCPLGGLLSLIQRLSPVKVRRHAPACINCKRCDRACPTKLDVSTARAVSHDCLMCLRCTANCPASGALAAALPGYEDPPKPGRLTLPSRWLVPAIAVVFLLGSVPVGMASGWWQTTGQSVVTLSNPQLEDIKGSSALADVSAAFSIPQTELYRILGLPADIPPDTKLKDLEEYNEVSDVRAKVGAYLGLPVEGETPAVMTPATTPAAEPTKPASAALPAAEIKGTMTLQQVSEQCGIPLDALYSELKLGADVSPATTLKDLQTLATPIETSVVRDVVAAYQSAHP